MNKIFKATTPRNSLFTKYYIYSAAFSKSRYVMSSLLQYQPNKSLYHQNPFNKHANNTFSLGLEYWKKYNIHPYYRFNRSNDSEI